MSTASKNLGQAACHSQSFAGESNSKVLVMLLQQTTTSIDPSVCWK